MIIQQFIDTGYYTVPLKGKLKCTKDGKKTLPIFEKNWCQKYTNNLNTNVIQSKVKKNSILN